MMVPVFGQGIQYGAPPKVERQQLKMQARGLRQDRMKTYAAVIAREVEDWVSNWGEAGELDVYEAFTKLTLKTSTHCLMGADFRYTLTDEFAELYHDLEYAVSPAALRDPNGQEEVAIKRDRARARLGELISERIALRRQDTQEHDDMLQVYLDARYEKVRHGGSVRDCAVLIAIGVLDDGRRSVLGVSVSLSEAEVHWRGFLKSLIDRGLHGVQLIVSDDHPGLKQAPSVAVAAKRSAYQARSRSMLGNSMITMRRGCQSPSRRCISPPRAR